MFSRHPETNPHFSPSEVPPSNQDAPNLPSPVLQRMNQPRRQRTPSGPQLEPHYPLHVRDEGPHSQPKSRLEQVPEPRDRVGRPAGEMVLPPEGPRDRVGRPSGATMLSPEGPDYPDHYPLHPYRKGSPSGPVLPPPRRGKSSKTRVQWEQEQPPSQPQPQPGDEHALPPGGPAPSTAASVPEEGKQNQRRRRRRHRSDLLVPAAHKTKALTWIIAVCCALFWIIIILGGLIVLIVYLMFRPHIPRFDIASATLNAAYLDTDYLLNADLTLLANFTNPNRKVHVDFSHVILDLYYGNVPIATQYIKPFSAMRAEYRLASVHMISSQVRLPPKESQQLRKQIESNGPIVLEVKGLFRARSNLGSFLRYSYPLYSYCFISLTGPPSGVLRASRCKTKR